MVIVLGKLTFIVIWDDDDNADDDDYDDEFEIVGRYLPQSPN